MKTKKSRNLEYISLLLTVFLEILGIGMIIPILPELITFSSSVFSISQSTEIKNIIYGITISVWPLGIFIGSAILGAMSDRYGKRKILIANVFMIGISYLIAIISFILGILWLFIISRFISGLFSSTVGIVQAKVLDITLDNKKGFYLGLITVFATLAMIVGPIITGLFSSTKIFGNCEILP